MPAQLSRDLPRGAELLPLTAVQLYPSKQDWLFGAEFPRDEKRLVVSDFLAHLLRRIESEGIAPTPPWDPSEVAPAIRFVMDYVTNMTGRWEFDDDSKA